MTYVTAWTAMTHTVFISAMTVIKELLTVHPGHVSVQSTDRKINTDTCFYFHVILIEECDKK